MSRERPLPPGPNHHVCVLRLSDGEDSETLEYRGVLMSPLEVGAHLVVLLSESKRLITSAIQRIHVNSSGRVLVDTTRSTYVVQFLGGLSPLYQRLLAQAGLAAQASGA